MSTFFARRVPPVAVWLVLALLMAACRYAFSDAVLPIGAGMIVVLSIAPAVIGVLIAVAGVVAFRRADTTVDPRVPDRSSALVTSGIYRYTRNPMYLGLALALAGWAAWLAHPAALIGPPAFVLWIHRMQIPFEERAMRARFGEAFDRYRRTTRRWI